MTQKEKYEKLDKELRLKYEHLSEYEYQQVRTQYINSRLRRILLKTIFRGFVIPWGTGILLLVLLLTFIGENVSNLSGKGTGFIMVLWSTAIAIWMGVELFRCHEERDELPTVDAGLLSFKQLSRVIGGSRRWQTGKYRLVARRATTKSFDKGGVEDNDTFWLFFHNPGGKPMKHRVREDEYGDMKTGDLYYLVLKKSAPAKRRFFGSTRQS